MRFQNVIPDPLELHCPFPIGVHLRTNCSHCNRLSLFVCRKFRLSDHRPHPRVLRFQCNIQILFSPLLHCILLLLLRGVFTIESRTRTLFTSSVSVYNLTHRCRFDKQFLTNHITSHLKVQDMQVFQDVL